MAQQIGSVICGCDICDCQMTGLVFAKKPHKINLNNKKFVCPNCKAGVHSV
jgi:hypothetical protein